MDVAVVGARGRMGQATINALQEAPDFTVHAEIDLGDALNDVAGADAAVIFTSPDAALDAIRACIDAGVPALVGTTGFDDRRIAEVASWCAATPGATVMIVPNFGIGALLMMRFAREAAKYFPAVEIIEEHHPAKVDAPSGTALRTAELIAEGRDAGEIPIHSVRLPGRLAHQSVIFGGAGETLTIRHDSLDRASFMPGVLLALQHLREHPGLTVGLEAVLGWSE